MDETKLKSIIDTKSKTINTKKFKTYMDGRDFSNVCYDKGIKAFYKFSESQKGSILTELQLNVIIYVEKVFKDVKFIPHAIALDRNKLPKGCPETTNFVMFSSDGTRYYFMDSMSSIIKYKSMSKMIRYTTSDNLGQSCVYVNPVYDMMYDLFISHNESSMKDCLREINMLSSLIDMVETAHSSYVYPLSQDEHDELLMCVTYKFHTIWGKELDEFKNGIVLETYKSLKVNPKLVAGSPVLTEFYGIEAIVLLAKDRLLKATTKYNTMISDVWGIVNDLLPYEYIKVREKSVTEPYILMKNLNHCVQSFRNIFISLSECRGSSKKHYQNCSRLDLWFKDIELSDEKARNQFPDAPWLLPDGKLLIFSEALEFFRNNKFMDSDKLVHIFYSEDMQATNDSSVVYEFEQFKKFMFIHKEYQNSLQK